MTDCNNITYHCVYYFAGYPRSGDSVSDDAFVSSPTYPRSAPPCFGARNPIANMGRCLTIGLPCFVALICLVPSGSSLNLVLCIQMVLDYSLRFKVRHSAE